MNAVAAATDRVGQAAERMWWLFTRGIRLRDTEHLLEINELLLESCSIIENKKH